MGALPALLSFGMAIGWSGGVELTPVGPDGDVLLGADDLDEAAFTVRASEVEPLAQAQVTLDGEPADGVSVDGDRLTWKPGRITDGEHHVQISVNRPFPLRDRTVAWTFTVDTTPPEVAVEVPGEAVPYDQAVTVSGTVEEGTTVEVHGAEATVDGDAVQIAFAAPPLTSFDVVATDAAGNATTQSVRIPVELPEIRGVHMTAVSWQADTLREPVLQMIEEGRINTVELDLKDEGGLVGYDSQVPLAREIGAVEPYYDLEEVVQQLHDKGVRVVGRLVAFRDPVLAEYAWERGDREQVIQTPGGGFYGKYGGFTNFANDVVRQYNIDLAVEAAEAGIDEILYDYIRRPDGELSGMVFPGLEGPAEDAIVSFLADSRAQLREFGTIQGAAVFGIAATRPDEIAQDIPRMAEHVDYVAPMVYPSHWGPGEYDVASPNEQPYDIVYASMKDFQQAVAQTDARVVPWLQDFTLGVSYGAAEVRAQIQAARDAGIDEWLMWDPRVTYTTAAYEPREDN
jgi:hypothetical protein